MNKRLANKWADALVSGKFKQETGGLCKFEQANGASTKKVLGHCCLGVLTEVLKLKIEPNDGVLTSEACLAAAISDDAGEPTDKGGVTLRIGNTYRKFPNLAEANDEGASFRSIATWIRKNYKRLGGKNE